MAQRKWSIAQLRELGIQIARKFRQDRVGDLAASLAYSTVLSLVPILALTYFCLDLVGEISRLRLELEAFIIPNLAPALGNQVLSYVDSIRANVSPQAIGLFGFLGFLAMGFSLLSKIEGSLNLIWGVKARRTLWRRLLVYGLILVVGPVLMAVSLVLTGQVVLWLRHDHGEISKFLLFFSAFLPYVATVLLFWSLFVWLPAGRVCPKSGLWAAIWSGLIFESGKQAYAFYAARALGHSAYGSLAAFPVFLVWLDLGWVIVLTGAALSFLLQQPDQRADKLS